MKTIDHKNKSNKRAFFFILFFRGDLYAVQIPSVLSIASNIFWWRQNDAKEKSAQHSTELMKHVLMVTSKKVTLQNLHQLNGTFSRTSRLLQANETFCLGRLFL